MCHGKVLAHFKKAPGKKPSTYFCALILLLCVFLETPSQAEESKGVGFVLYHALLRNQAESESGSLFNCAWSMKRGELYEIEFFDEGRIRVSTKIKKGGECLINETVEIISKRHPCLAEELKWAVSSAQVLDLETKSAFIELESQGFHLNTNPQRYFTSVMISSTDPTVEFIEISKWNLAWLVDWIPSATASESVCPFKIEIRQNYQTPQGRIPFKVITSDQMLY